MRVAAGHLGGTLLEQELVTGSKSRRVQDKEQGDEGPDPWTASGHGLGLLGPYRRHW